MDIFGFLLIVLGVTGATVLTIVKLGIDYSSRKHGLKKGATERELQEVRRELASIHQKIEGLEEMFADVTLMLRDSQPHRIGIRDALDRSDLGRNEPEVTSDDRPV